MMSKLELAKQLDLSVPYVAPQASNAIEHRCRFLYTSGVFWMLL
jgi:hypothetical protein